MTEDWKIFKGDNSEHEGIKRLPPPPKWRDFSKSKLETRGETFKATGKEVEAVNLALYLRRPILVTGPPGSGKSSLAYAVARELKLGEVLYWGINSRSTRQEGLYSYDAIARLRDANLKTSGSGDDSDAKKKAEDIGRYIRLGPLGTAMYTGDHPEPAKDKEQKTGQKEDEEKKIKIKPRVLLIDEIDKSDIDLPNDLLHIFEEGEYIIPELAREETGNPIRVMPFDGQEQTGRVPIRNGRVRCHQFPLVIMTSNGERELPPAFLRRCLRLDTKPPNKKGLEAIIEAHLKQIPYEEYKEPLEKFIEKRDDKKLVLATDQLLNSVFMLTRNLDIDPGERERLLELLLREIGKR